MRLLGITPVLGLFAATVAATPARAAPSQVATVSATVVKPLTLKWVQDLDLGTIVLAPGSWSGASVSISQAGVFRCINPNTTCSGLAQAAAYTVSGSNNEVVRITAPNVTLTNQSDPTKTLTLVVDNPGTVTLDNGGKKGTTFNLGGSIALSSATAGGLYIGTFDVTVDY